ncbi:hypothetical protein ACJMK2_037630 [Sinanodonta woodiana]|uniref:ATP-dependent RNA helicase TDRD9 n=1 Tax=Sinanodonta woodiana TaxID=1069815 RepID=A0ABD3WPJ5_SINWO
MSRLTGEITTSQIDEWFKIGKKSVIVNTIPRSKTKGYYIDPRTQQPIVPEKEHVPDYKSQHILHNGYDYVSQYQEEEESRLLSLHGGAPQEGAGAYGHFRGDLESLEVDSSVAGGIAMPTDLIPENATEVYRQYDFSHAYDGKLPISHFKDEVVNTIESNQVTIIQGATGSGKTTQVPQFILDHYVEQGKYCNIVVTQPRRIAAISIARRVCHERSWNMGTVCGYQVGLDKTASPDTRILFCTTGVLLQKLISAKNMLEFTHVILDEVHERDQDTDFCLLVVRKLMRTNSRHVKVVLMSATFESSLFANYFALPLRDKLESAPVVNVEGKPFKVSEFYAEDIAKLGEIPPLDEGLPEISPQARNLCIRLIQEFDKLELKEQGASKTRFAPVRGTVLVFLPGIGEITDLDEELQNLAQDHQLVIIPLHSTITLEEQSRAFNIPPEGYRKVILSTNIAESSITVPDIKYVIDFCLTKQQVCDFETNYTSLQVQWTSKASCIQRKGRAGRVSNGRVYRLITRKFWQDSISDYSVPEMQRSPLDRLILQVKLLDLGEPKAILALALSPPNLDDIERNILMLKEVGALTSQVGGVRKRHDGELTFIGRVLAHIPVDIRIGKLIVFGHVFGLLEECLIIGAAMSLKSIFAKPFKKKLDAYRMKLSWADGSFSDCLAILNAYRVWEDMKNRGEFKRSGRSEYAWGDMRYIQIRRLREIAMLINDLEKRLQRLNISKPKKVPDYKKSEDQERLLLKLVMCAAFYPNYFVRGEIDEQESLKVMSGCDPLNTVMVKGLPANQGLLYKMALVDQFKCCDKSPTVFFEETRAYIQFPWKPNMTSKVHPGVYMALKMRQLRMPISIELYSAEETREMLSMLQLEKEKVAGPNRLRTHRLTQAAMVTEEAGGQRIAFQVPPPPATQQFVCLEITEVVDCGHFWAQYKDEKTFQQMYRVQESLNINRGQHLRPMRGPVAVGSFCVAPYKDETVEYYRAKVQSLDRRCFKENGKDVWRDIVEVFFVDYGNSTELPKEELRELPSDLLQIPFQAVECRLKGIRPSAIKCPDGKWTKEALEIFRTLIAVPRICAQIYSVVHGILRVELIDASAGRQIFINQKMIDDEIADEAEESFLSKQNHEQRLNEASYAMNKPDEFTAKQDSSLHGGYDWLAVSMDTTNSVPTQSKKRGSRANLHGPNNPYEMNFYSITNVGRLRNVKIDPDSVNSIAIDDEPQDQHQRMMVAGYVGLNPSGTSMIARDSTIMPLIPGLPALVCLLFSPMAEIRIDAKKSCYIGALCGLGADPVTGYPVFQDHDMEIPFDVSIDIDDIQKINAVRMAINIAVGSQGSVASWGQEAIFKIQEPARQKLLDLVQRRRQSVNVQHFDRPFMWNQVDPEDGLEHGLEGTIADCPDLLSLHKAIVVQVEEEHQEENPLKKHVRMLREVVKSNTKRGTTRCELCGVNCSTPQLLAFHLETQKHKDQEDKLDRM